MSSLALFAAAVFVSCATAHHDDLSRHFIAEALPVTDVVVAAEMTAGPFFETKADYIAGGDMTVAGRAGAAGVATDRSSVVDGVPLWLTLNVYRVSSGATEAVEFADADVYLWHCDAVGVYSAVATAGTEGQKWLRGVQTTSANGSVVFRTILPGWYPGRPVHFHLSVGQAGESKFAITTQLFFSDEFVSTYKAAPPYSGGAPTITPLARDGIFAALPAAARDKLVLKASGSSAEGYAATFNLGIQLTAPASTATPADATTVTSITVPVTPADPTTTTPITTMTSITTGAPAATGGSLLGPILSSGVPSSPVVVACGATVLTFIAVLGAL